MPTIPPSDSPHHATRSSPSVVEQRKDVGGQVGHRVRAARHRGAAVAAVVDADHPEAAGQRHLRPPHLQRGPQRPGEHQNGRVPRALVDVVELDVLRHDPTVVIARSVDSSASDGGA